VRDAANGVERVHERVAAGIRVEGVDEAPVGARGAGGRIALHHPVALRAVGDRAGEQTVGAKVVRADDVTVEVRARDVLDQVEALAVR